MVKEHPVAGEPLVERMGEVTIDPESQDVLQTHAGEEDLQ